MSKKLTPPQQCPRCQKLCSWFTGTICHNCYRRYKWKRKLIECKKCKRMLPMKAKGYCGGCYNTLFHLEYTKAFNCRKYPHIKHAVCGLGKLILATNQKIYK